MKTAVFGLISLLTLNSLQASDKLSHITCTPFLLVGKNQLTYELEAPTIQASKSVKIAGAKFRFSYNLLRVANEDNIYQPVELILTSKKSSEKVNLAFKYEIIYQKEREAFAQISLNLFTEKYKNHATAILKPGTPQEFTLFVNKNSMVAATINCELE